MINIGSEVLDFDVGEISTKRIPWLWYGNIKFIRSKPNKIISIVMSNNAGIPTEKDFYTSRTGQISIDSKTSPKRHRLQIRPEESEHWSIKDGN